MGMSLQFSSTAPPEGAHTTNEPSGSTTKAKLEIGLAEAKRLLEEGWNLGWGRDWDSGSNEVVVTLHRNDICVRCDAGDLEALKEHALEVQGSAPDVEMPAAIDVDALKGDLLDEAAIKASHAVSACARQQRQLILDGRAWQDGRVRAVRKAWEQRLKELKRALRARGQSRGAITIVKSPFVAVWKVEFVEDGAQQACTVESVYFASRDNAKGYVAGSPTRAEMIQNNERALAAFKALRPLAEFKSLGLVRVYRKEAAGA